MKDAADQARSLKKAKTAGKGKKVGPFALRSRGTAQNERSLIVPPYAARCQLLG